MIRKILLLVAAGMILGTFSQSSFADCICTCSGGQPQALCSNKHLVRPACRNACPTAAPIPISRAPNCQMEQVMNAKTGSREWRDICK